MTSDGRFVVGDPSRAPVLASEAVTRAFRSMTLAAMGNALDARAELERVRVASRESTGDATLADSLREVERHVTEA